MTHSGLSHLPPRSLSLWLDYGDIFSHHPPIPSFSPFLYVFPPYICRLPLCLFIHSSAAKGGCQSRSSASPSPNPPHIPSSFLTFIHLALLSITVALFLSSLLFSLSPSHSFLPVWDFLDKRMCTLFLQSLPLFILVLLSPLLHSLFDLLFPLKRRDGKIARMQIFTLFFSADLSWRSSRVDTTSLIQMHHG